MKKILNFLIDMYIFTYRLATIFGCVMLYWIIVNITLDYILINKSLSDDTTTNIIIAITIALVEYQICEKIYNMIRKELESNPINQQS